MPPATRKTPQDRKPKTAAGFTFDHVGKTYVIPPPSEVLAQVDGRAFRDALMGGEEAELRLSLKCLELVCTDEATLDALYSKPAPEMLGIVAQWFQSADLSGATLPQS